MPIEDIGVVRAPRDWRPSTDQIQRIAEDSRLQRLSRDEQYMFFNKTPAPASRKAQPAKPPAKAPPKPNGGPAAGLFGWVDTVIAALRGG